MNKYLEHIEKQASISGIASGIFRTAGKGITAAGRGLGRMADTAAGSGYRKHVNDVVYGGKASVDDLYKIKSPTMAYRQTLKKMVADRRAAGDNGLLFARGGRTERVSALKTKFDNATKAKGFQPNPEDYSGVRMGTGHRPMQNNITPQRNTLVGLQHNQLDAKIGLGVVGVGSLYAGSKIHKKIRETLQGPEQYQYQQY